MTALFAVSAAAQDVPKPVPSSTPEDVVKITTSLVQVDVTVVDKDGRPIKDLKPSEIHIFENGKARKISGLSFIAGAPPADSLPDAASKDKKAPILPGRTLAPNEVRRTIAIVVDDITLSFQSVDYVRTVLRKFVDEQMQPGDLVAIIRSSGGMGALQQFTSDKRELYAAIQRIRWNAVMNGRIGAFAPIEAQLDFPQPADLPGAEPIESRRTLDEINQDNLNERAKVFTAGSLGALSYVLRGMEQLPGRKSMLMLSEGFSLFEREENGGSTGGRVLEAIQKITDAANRAGVVVYTLDPRGLQIPMLSAEDDTSGWSSEEIGDKVALRNQELRNTQDGLRYLAEETGGFAIVNNNNLSKGIRKILDDQSYYLLAYEPDDETFDPQKLRFNKLVVKVDRPGARVRYRRGFFNVDDARVEATRKPKGDRAVFDALTSPFSRSDLPVRFNAIFNSDEKIGPYLRSLVHLNIADLDFKQQADGKLHAAFDVFTYAFGENGIIAGQQEKAFAVTFTPEEYEKIRTRGIVYNLIFPVKKPGAYQLRLAIRDHNSDKIGSAGQFVEVPDLKKKRLSLAGIVLNYGSTASATDPLTATSLREFKLGSRLDYGTVVFNAKAGDGKTELSSRMRLFRDGKPVFEGKPQVVPQGTQAANAVAFMGSIDLGTKLAPGDYVLEVSVTDALAKSKYATAVQYVEFTITG
ncbi:MAG: VWA domain-containing protein [Acidobacteria bacterium]|nr:VWA domain-containing protein [Acidobacteriota bacterium]